MKLMLKVTLPVEKTNEVIKAGRLAGTMQSILSELKPEAVYFTEIDGVRSGFIFCELEDASQIPAFAEPFFLAFNAAVEFHPVMTPADLAKAGPSIEQAAKKYA